jgi:hypothetical protein
MDWRAKLSFSPAKLDFQVLGVKGLKTSNAKSRTLRVATMKAAFCTSNECWVPHSSPVSGLCGTRSIQRTSSGLS